MMFGPPSQLAGRPHPRSFVPMPVVHNTFVALRLFGDDLDPDELTRILGVEPSSAHRKGDVIKSSVSGATGVRKSGLWLLRAAERTPGDLNGQVSELLARLPTDPEVWKQVAIYKPDLSIGLFLEETNEGIELDVDAIRTLADRGIALDFDIYGPTGDGRTDATSAAD